MFAGPVPPLAPEPPAYVEGDDRFAGAGGHREQDAFLSLQDCCQRTIDRALMVIPAAFVARIGRCQKALGDGLRELHPGLVALPQLVWTGIGCNNAFLTGEVVELQDVVAVG